jgi:hypothetical protein
VCGVLFQMFVLFCCTDVGMRSMELGLRVEKMSVDLCILFAHQVRSSTCGVKRAVCVSNIQASWFDTCVFYC